MLDLEILLQVMNRRIILKCNGASFGPVNILVKDLEGRI